MKVVFKQLIPVEDERMIADFDDFCTWMYVTVDSLCNNLRPHLPCAGDHVYPA